MNPNINKKLLAVSTVALSLFYFIVVFAEDLFPKFKTGATELRVALPYWTAVLTLFIGFIVSNLYDIEN